MGVENISPIHRYDIIIIGGGLAGLTAGSKLAKAGKKVLLIEQHNVVGGCATVFKRKREMIFEVGLHETGSVHNRSMYHDLEVYNQIEFVKVPEFFRLIRGQLDIILPDNVNEAKNSLSIQFPEEKKAINKFFNDIINVRKQIKRLNWPIWKLIILFPILPLLLRNLIFNLNTNVGEYIDKLTKNEDLKLTLIGNLAYYHDDPYTTSYLFYATGQASYLIGGGYFVKGGSQKLSDALANTITKYGGTIVLKHLVEEIIIENKIAVGVKYRRQKRPTEGELIAYGKIIIANAAIPNVVNKLIPSMKNDEYTKQINSLELPCSLISIYIAFSEDISQLVDNRYSTFIYNEEVNTLKDFTKFERNGDYLKKGMVFVNYDAIDNGLSTEKYHIASICAIDYIDNWKFKEKEEYKKRKDEVTQIFLEKLENTFPGIKKYVVYTEMSTPRTIERYTLNPNGIVYGFAQTPKQAMLNRRKYSKSPVKNLYFASAWGFPGGGFGGTIAGGYMTALKILKKDKD